MPSREDYQIVITGQDQSGQAFASLQRNVQGGKAAVGQLQGALAGLGHADFTSLLALPAGLAGLGGSALAMGAVLAPLAGIVALSGRVKEGADAFKQYARDTREAAEQSQLGIAPTQALIDLFQRHGVEAQTASAFVNRFAQSHAQAARGEGELFTELRRVNAGLAEQFASARSTTDALEIFTNAVAGADEGTQRLLARAAAGRGGGSLLPALRDLAGSGGLGAVTASAIKAGAALDDNLIMRMATAAVEAERKAKIVERNWNAAYAAIYQQWKDFKRSIGLTAENEIAVALKVKASVDNSGDGNWLWQLLAKGAGALGGPAMGKVLENAIGRTGQALTARSNDNFRPDFNGAFSDVAGASRAPKPRTEDDITNDLQRQVNTERQRLSLLGDLASATEVLRARENEITLARRQGVQLSGEEARLLKEVTAAQLGGRELALRAQVGAGTEAEYLTQHLAELQLLLARGKISWEEYGQAVGVAGRAAVEFGRQQEVMKSALPGLTRLGQEAGDLRIQIDTEFSGALRGITQDLTAMTKGTLTLGDGLKQLSTRFLDAALNALFMKTVVGPLASAVSGGLGSLFGGASTGAGHSGGMVGELGMRRMVDPLVFAGAPRFHTGGLVGGEVPVIAKQGEEIGWPSDLARKYGGGEPVINVHNYGKEQPEVSTRRGTDGSLMIDLIVGRVKEKIGRGDMDDVMSRFAGGSPRLARR